MSAEPEMKTPCVILKELTEKLNKRLSFEFTGPYNQNGAFKCAALIDSTIVSHGEGNSKKLAKQQASLKAIEKLAQDKHLKHIAQEIYYGKESALPKDPVSALYILTQKRKADLKIETPAVCRVYVNGELAGSAEASTAKEAKLRSCVQTISWLTNSDSRVKDLLANLPSEEVVESHEVQTAVGAYLRLKVRDLELSSETQAEVNAAVARVLGLQQDFHRFGIAELCAIGAYAAGCMRRDKLQVDFALVPAVAGFQVDKFTEALLQLFLDQTNVSSSLPKKRKRTEAAEPDAFHQTHFSLKIGEISLIFIEMQSDSPSIAHIKWLLSQPLNYTQRSVLLLLRYWKSLRAEKRTVPTELLDWLVARQISQSGSVGSGFRSALESVTGGIFLPGHTLDGSLPCHDQILSVIPTKTWPVPSRTDMMAEAFVTLVQVAKEEASAVM